MSQQTVCKDNMKAVIVTTGLMITGLKIENIFGGESYFMLFAPMETPSSYCCHCFPSLSNKYPLPLSPNANIIWVST